MKIEGHTISYALLDSKPAIDDGREIVRVQVSCDPPYHGFTHVVMQFAVPAAVVLPTDGAKKTKKKDAAAVVVSDARDKAIRERVLWKAKQELGQVAKDLADADLQEEAA